jgi:hypothetical protein
MDANILCTLLAQRIPPEQFQLWGLEVHLMSPEYVTPENRAIVSDVIANYEALAAAYEARKIDKINTEKNYQMLQNLQYNRLLKQNKIQEALKIRE